MSNYTVSARKYRPVTFSSVVGQDSLTTTLKNAIASGKLANSYLFCGPRGVGKTTCARLFAKTINCLNPTPDGEACGECESCSTFNAELRSYNVFELDAASNNSVEDIRTLTEQVRIPPISGKYKVYIIDEVHMLSTAAFNAFLKTLEEPPSYAIFILATTEKHKVIPTILSRCQIYDFNRISNSDIVAHLKGVASQENIEVDNDALNVIAEKADGGMRDALSIFDQITSFTGGHVTYDLTIRNLNIIDQAHYFKLTDLFLENRIPESLLLLNDIMSRGFDPSHLISGLLVHFRNLLVSRDACTLPLLEMSDEMRARYHEQAMRCKPKFLYKAMKLCNDCDLNYRVSNNKRLLVELTLIRLSQSAAGEDDESDGRGPASLKPIFSKSVQAPSASQDSSKKVTGKPSAVQSTHNEETIGKETGATPAKPSSTNAQPRIPKVSPGKLFTPFRGVKTEEKPAGNPPEKTDKTVTESASRQVIPLDQEKLELFWKDYAASLPQKEAPLLNRMMNQKPVVVSPTEFAITVMNQMAADEFKSKSGAITRFLQEKFNNSRIEMTVNIDKTKSDTRILSESEQLESMINRNPALGTLIDEFGLTIS